MPGLQGEIVLQSGEHEVHVGAGDALVVGQHLPVISRITQAEADVPYLAIVLSLNLMTLRELHAKIGTSTTEDAVDSAISCLPSNPDWLEPLKRYLLLSHEPQTLRVIGPSILQEIHYRLLMSPTGAILHNLLLSDSHANRIAQAITRIRGQLSMPLRVPDLAREIGMSNSAFHDHFKNFTGTTPLQFQKDLRMITSRSLLESGAYSVSSAAFEIGYESPTHSSRDYKRKYGHSPSTLRS